MLDNFCKDVGCLLGSQELHPWHCDRHVRSSQQGKVQASRGSPYLNLQRNSYSTNRLKPLQKLHAHAPSSPQAQPQARQCMRPKHMSIQKEDHEGCATQDD